MFEDGFPYTQDDDIPLTDRVSIEQDRRKLEDLLNKGIITARELAEAPIVEIEDTPYNFDGKPHQKIVGITCGMCQYECKTMQQLQKHILKDHHL